MEKYSLGIRIENLILDITELLLTASYSPRGEKINFLIKADAKISFLKLLIRLANETKIIDNKKYLILQEKLQEIGKMLGGWMHSIRND